MDSTFIQDLERERKLFEVENYEGRDKQINSFKAKCRLLRDNLRYTYSTRQRKMKAKENFRKISNMSSSVFFLSCKVPEHIMATRTIFMPKLHDWWQKAEYPENLRKLVQQLCEAENIEYIETGQCNI